MLTQRILALVALALTPALAIQGYNEYALRTSRDAAVRADALGTARTVAADLEQLAQSLRQVLDLVGTEDAVRRKDAGACTAYLGAIIERLPQLSLLSVAEPDGRVVCDSRGSSPGLYSNAERAYHKRVLASDDFAVGDFVIGVRTRQPAVHFAQPVRGYDYRLTGVVVASVDLARLSERLQADLRFAITTLTVTDPAGTVLVRRPDHAAWVGRKLSGERLARLMRADETTRSVEGLDGRARIVGIAKPDGALAGFNVIVGRDRETAFADIDAATYRGIAVILLGALLAVLATLLAGRRFIERPVRRLLRGVAAWQGGDLDVRTGMSGPSEFDRLGAAFDAMATTLQGREDDLHGEIARGRRMQEQQTTMLHELNHRVKNTLATVQSLARQARGGEAQAAQLEARILALSKTHDLLTREDWTGASLRDVLENELAPYRTGADHITLDGPDVPLPPRYALAIGMTVHELATNAAKYGALSDVGGQVRVAWRLVHCEAGDRRLHLDWQESGGPRVEPPSRSGFGTRLIAGGMQRELGGEVRLTFDPTGLRCLLDVPLQGSQTSMLSPLTDGLIH
ncbi:sensor histidine kinase [Methylobacterium platani]|uniref:histidine kinase n=2 Tax=Methylobacterium platani TaxID=427683 RepID=A0A179S5N0_9HYPH|nr:HWE histidine kinase domain-containing protein [Methylobacterium platani]KMO22419.1 histidine kinase [Methylobacterium platani JCM 14648]OAS22505.1 histidine kinase [Methylobacterium platani]